MTDFRLHDTASAPEGGKPLLEAVQKKYGFAPNLIRTMVESPAAAEGYMTLSGIFDKSGFSPVERQVVLLSTSAENGCTYCMAAHSAIAKMAKMPDDVLEALREGKKIKDKKLEALRSFTRTMVEQRGWADEKAIKAFLDAGYQKRHVLDVVLGIAVKTMSNYVNHIAETPLDEAFKPLAWSAPASRVAAE